MRWEECRGVGIPGFSPACHARIGSDVSIESGSPLPHQMLPPPEIFIYLEKVKPEKKRKKGNERKKEASTKPWGGEGSPAGCKLNVGWGQLPGFPGPRQIYLFLQ